MQALRLSKVVAISQSILKKECLDQFGVMSFGRRAAPPPRRWDGRPSRPPALDPADQGQHGAEAGRGEVDVQQGEPRGQPEVHVDDLLVLWHLEVDGNKAKGHLLHAHAVAARGHYDLVDELVGPYGEEPEAVIAVRVLREERNVSHRGQPGRHVQNPGG